MIATNSDAIYVTLDSSGGVFFTVFSGVLVFVLGQLFIEAVLKPYMRYKQLKSKISYSLVLYGNIYSDPMTHDEYWNASISSIRKEEYDNVSRELRELASELAGFLEEKWIINFYLPRNEQIAMAVSELIGLSNSMIVPGNVDKHREYNRQRVKIIVESLRLSKGFNL